MFFNLTSGTNIGEYYITHEKGKTKINVRNVFKDSVFIEGKAPAGQNIGRKTVRRGF